MSYASYVTPKLQETFKLYSFEVAFFFQNNKNRFLKLFNKQDVHKKNPERTMPSPVGLKDLARLLGLAPSTVSRALKGHPDISEATQEKVKAMAEHLHYRPSALARSLRKQCSYLLAVIVPRINSYFYAEVVSGMVELAYRQGYRMVLFESLDQYEREAAICNSLEKSGIDGVLVVPAQTTVQAAHFKKMQEAHIPFLFCERWVGELSVDRVLEDDYNGAYSAVSHLIDQGCCKIVHIALPQDWVWGQKRQLGYVQALLNHHLSVNRDWIVEYQKKEEVEEITKKLMREVAPDGIFVATDEGALCVLNTLKALGCRVPNDVAVCGYGNEPFTAVTCPALTTVDRKAEQLGEMAVDILIRRLNREEGESKTYLLKNDLVIRESSRLSKAGEH